MNEEQIAYWNGPAGERWTAQQEVLDRALAAFSRAALERAGARRGEHVLDVGCGCGTTSLALADSVGDGGSVLGVDVSAQMLARARATSGARANLTFTHADAAAARFPREYDLVFSRFGVMFFQEPLVAFRNLRAAGREGGRLVFICWRAAAQNPWTKLPMTAVLRVLSEAPPPPAPDAPGPYSFADRERVARIVAGAGFRDVAFECFDADVVLSASTFEAAIDFAVSSGPVARFLVGAPPDVQTRAREEVRKELAPHYRSAGLSLPGSCWIVNARV